MKVGWFGGNQNGVCALELFGRSNEVIHLAGAMSASVAYK